jgi:probable rRNA maturation factor
MSKSRKPGDAVTSVVEIVNRQKVVRIDAVWLGRVARRAIAEIGIDAAAITVVVVDDAEIAALHDRWMGLPDPTDVLTFDLSERDGVIAGDIVVSAETARRVAREVGWQPREELAYYVCHGLLHLSGFDDVTPGERRRMRRKEREVMVAIGLPAPPRRRHNRPYGR